MFPGHPPPGVSDRMQSQPVLRSQPPASSAPPPLQRSSFNAMPLVPPGTAAAAASQSGQPQPLSLAAASRAGSLPCSKTSLLPFVKATASTFLDNHAGLSFDPEALFVVEFAAQEFARAVLEEAIRSSSSSPLPLDASHIQTAAAKLTAATGGLVQSGILQSSLTS